MLVLVTEGGAITAPPTSRETRRRYDAISEAIFLAGEHGQLQSVAAASTKPSDSPGSANSASGSLRKARPPLAGGASQVKMVAASTSGLRPHTSPTRKGSVTYPDAIKTCRTSVSRGVRMSSLLPSRMSQVFPSTDPFVDAARRFWLIPGVLTHVLMAAVGLWPTSRFRSRKNALTFRDESDFYAAAVPGVVRIRWTEVGRAWARDIVQREKVKRTHDFDRGGTQRVQKIKKTLVAFQPLSAHPHGFQVARST